MIEMKVEDELCLGGGISDSEGVYESSSKSLFLFASPSGEDSTAVDSIHGVGPCV